MTYSSSTVFCLCLIVPDILYLHLYLFPGILLLFDFILSLKVNLKVCCLLIKCLCFPVFIFRGHIKKFSEVIPNSLLDVPLGDGDWTWTFHIQSGQASHLVFTAPWVSPCWALPDRCVVFFGSLKCLPAQQRLLLFKIVQTKLSQVEQDYGLKTLRYSGNGAGQVPSHTSSSAPKNRFCLTRPFSCRK